MSRHETDIKSRIAFNLSAAMETQEVSSAEIARRLGLNEKTVRRWRGGEVMPSIERLAELGELLDRDITAFYLPPQETAA